MNNIPYEKELVDKIDALYITSNKRRRNNEGKEDNCKDRKKIIKKGNLFIKVDSAFGGLAIYKPIVFLNSLYSTNQTTQSEHVYFHKTSDNANRSFYINPKLINNWFNSYNVNKFYFIRFIREFMKLIRHI